MEWYWMLLLIFGGLIIIMMTGMPVAFCFLLVNLIGFFFFFGGAGLKQLAYSMYTSLNTFTLVPIPLFILMGDVLFFSGIAPLIINSLDKWIGRIPGRLSLLAVGAGTLFGALSGASMATVAVLGSTLAPEMEKRGYKKPMSIGPILSTGALDMMIPPSNIAVLLGALAAVSIGELLISIIVPGLLLAVLYTGYIVVRCKLQPTLAPTFDVPPTPLLQKCIDTTRYVLPIGFVIFMVTGVIFLGVATPSEAAATGALACLILAAFYGKLNWATLKKSFTSTIEVSVMIFLILASAGAYSQIVAYTGAVQGLTQLVTNLHVAPIIVMIGMQIVLLLLGTFLGIVPILMITIPLFMPVAAVMGFDEVWFATVFLLNMAISDISPPFGLSLFVMKGVAPNTTLGDVFRAAMPFLYIDIVAMALVIAFPALALWLPALMRN